MKPPLWSRRALVAGAIGVAALAGCSSSSSGGGTAGNGSPAAHSVTFHNLTPAENKRVQTVLPLMRGVATNTYQDGDLVVVFKSTATKADQTNVANTVQTAKNAAAAKTASPKSKKK
jgi:hypothetical protein